MLWGRSMKPLKEKISITIDSDILLKLREKSEHYDRSLSQFINIILKDYLENSDEREDLKKVFSGR
jgi:metal-responsive CopG/Arc/MetJ family transcriptional regulator